MRPDLGPADEGANDSKITVEHDDVGLRAFSDPSELAKAQLAGRCGRAHEHGIDYRLPERRDEVPEGAIHRQRAPRQCSIVEKRRLVTNVNRLSAEHSGRTHRLAGAASAGTSALK